MPIYIYYICHLQQTKQRLFIHENNCISNFYTTVTITLIKQIWDSKIVDKSVFLGLMSGYISLGLITFFMFLAIESSFPNSLMAYLII